MIAVAVVLAIGLAAYCLWAASTDFGVVGLITQEDIQHGAQNAGGFFLIMGLGKSLAAMMLCVAAGFMWRRM